MKGVSGILKEYYLNSEKKSINKLQGYTFSELSSAPIKHLFDDLNHFSNALDLCNIQPSHEVETKDNKK